MPPAAIAALVLLVLAGTWVGLWFHATTTLRAAILAEADALRRDGWRVEHGALRTGGFPLRAMIHLPALHVEGPAAVPALAGLRLAMETASLSVLPWDLDALSLNGGGTVDLAAPAWLSGPKLNGRLGRLHGRLERDALGRLARLDLAAADLEAADGVQVEGLDLRLEAPALRSPVSLQDASFRLTLTLHGATLPALETVLGPRLDDLTVAARVMGPVDRTLSLSTAAARWRDDGGTVELDAVRLDWPPLGLSATGTLALDKDMQPVAALSSHITGLFPLLDRLEDAGWMRPRDGSVARVVLGTLARRDAAGEPLLILPLTVQSQALTLGPARLLPLPPLAWPAAPPAPAASVPAVDEVGGSGFTVDRWGNVVPRE